MHQLFEDLQSSASVVEFCYSTGGEPGRRNLDTHKKTGMHQERTSIVLHSSANPQYVIAYWHVPGNLEEIMIGGGWDATLQDQFLFSLYSLYVFCPVHCPQSKNSHMLNLHDVLSICTKKNIWFNMCFLSVTSSTFNWICYQQNTDWPRLSPWSYYIILCRRGRGRERDIYALKGSSNSKYGSTI